MFIVYRSECNMRKVIHKSHEKKSYTNKVVTLHCLTDSALSRTALSVTFQSLLFFVSLLSTYVLYYWKYVLHKKLLTIFVLHNVGKLLYTVYSGKVPSSRLESFFLFPNPNIEYF